jgi:transposase
MLYVGIDQHKRHLTICIRDEQGDIALRRQVRTSWLEVDRFLEGLRDRSACEGGYVAIMEVCGFNGWLVERLERWACQRALVIAAPERVRQKTDRRDAAKLSELLWSNRHRLAGSGHLVQVREIYRPTASEQIDRQLTHLRWRLGRERTRIKNAMQGILRRHNLEQECPTKTMFSMKAFKWLMLMELPWLDRVELDFQIERYQLVESQIQRVQRWIDTRACQNPTVQLLQTMAKMGRYTALALAAHIGSVQRFPRAGSLANYFGITPGCRNSGNADRPGGITKAGHPIVRFLLGQLVLHALRTDPGLRDWYRQVKRRRGAKVARVAVMRRLCEALWHMLRRQEPYRPVDKPEVDKDSLMIQESVPMA